MNWIFNSVRGLVDKTEKGGIEENERSKLERRVMNSKEGRMTVLKSALESNIEIPPGSKFELETDLVYKALVPKEFSRSELDSLFLEAAASENWFVMVNRELTIFNPDVIKLK